MNRKGFTLIELLATLLILALVAGITVYSVSGIFKSTKEKTEEVFVETIKDSLEMYLNSSDAKNLTFGTTCRNTINKTHGERKVYRSAIFFDDVINSEYKPITQDDLVNPANENICFDADYIRVDIYRDEDYVYYYNVAKSSFGCLVDTTGNISNLPEGYSCR